MKDGKGTEGRGHKEFLENEAWSQGCWIILLLSNKVCAAAVCVCVGLDVQQAYGSKPHMFRFQRLVATCCCVGSI